MAISNLAIQMVSHLGLMDREKVPTGRHMKPLQSPRHQYLAVSGEGGRRI
jgi:hypothetical protein